MKQDPHVSSRMKKCWPCSTNKMNLMVISPELDEYCFSENKATPCVEVNIGEKTLRASYFELQS